jgi:hypothetical protein
MDDLFRQELERLFAEQDAMMAEARRAPLVTKQQDAAGLVFKTHEPQPAQPAHNYEHEWNSWCDARCDARILAMFEPRSGQMGNVIAEVISIIRRQMREHVAEEIGKLRADMAVQAAAQRHEDSALTMRRAGTRCCRLRTPPTLLNRQWNVVC